MKLEYIVLNLFSELIGLLHLRITILLLLPTLLAGNQQIWKEVHRSESHHIYF